MDQTVNQLTSIFREVFGDPELCINRETSASDIDDWDSIMHVTLLVNVESGFGIRFKSSEIASLKNVGELIELIEAKV